MKHKRLKFQPETCGTCEYWDDKSDGWIRYCPILKQETEMDDVCNDHKDIED
ncbi:hypothetical protein [Alkaliphilus sp. B6464]|uniref:hypothetical protein n=1 Tax=Alkaliphilus sp. B6464 TaxID=2731219 RepID=UPI001BAA1AD8|nr:hypothetical protein [Alkaliphilus sp. B6464]QUH21836.1 hypothetical protein HYG84_18030 [Alkaliphilus sp. B6464]